MENSNNERDIQMVTMKLLNGEVEIIKKALELYSYNLEYMMIDEHCDNEERQKKNTMIKCTFETIVAFQAQQVNGVSHNSETINKFGKNILNSENILEFIPNKEEVKAM